MKIEIEIDDIDVIERYNGNGLHREWGRSSWLYLYPGDIVAQISGESAKKIEEAIHLAMNPKKKQAPSD